MLTPEQIAKAGSEHSIQAAFFCALVPLIRVHPELALFHAVANGGHRDAITAGKLKAEGVRPGVPDTCLPVARRGYHSLQIEFKRPKYRTTKDGGLSEEQVKFIAMLRAEGNLVIVCYDWEHAIRATLGYLDADSRAGKAP